MKHQVLSVVVLTVAACAAPLKTRIVDTATTPLRDFNLTRDSIPALLLEAQKRPYVAPTDQSCGALSADVRALDGILGPDFDAPAPASSPSLAERGTAMVEDAAVGALRDAAEGIVPFRRWVRKLTGAERQSKSVAAALAAGTVRRAFLKGLSAARGCS